jgi:hypothetical protein
MEKIIPFEKALDRRDEKIKEGREEVSALLKEAEEIREQMILRRDHPHVANEEYIDDLNLGIADISRTIHFGKILLKKYDADAAENFKKKAELLKKRAE